VETQTLRRFKTRREAGRELVRSLSKYTGDPSAVVLALPRGGVPVAYEVAMALRLPMDVFEVRKLGVPGHEELAMGAIGSGGGWYLNREIIGALDVDRAQIAAVVERERAELKRRERLYRDSRPRQEIDGKTVILVDDGVATGASMFAAIGALRSSHVARIVVAVPVGAVETCETLRGEVDELVCLRMPEQFYAVGTWYERFDQVSDDQVRALLNDAYGRTP